MATTKLTDLLGDIGLAAKQLLELEAIADRVTVKIAANQAALDTQLKTTADVAAAIAEITG